MYIKSGVLFFGEIMFEINGVSDSCMKPVAQKTSIPVNWLQRYMK